MVLVSLGSYHPWFEKKELMMDNEVGSNVFRPFERGWSVVCQIPEPVALQWALAVAPKANVSGYQNTPLETCTDKPHYGWCDKMGLILANDPAATKMVGVMWSDGIWYLIQKSRF